jgi:hypothetical protein
MTNQKLEITQRVLEITNPSYTKEDLKSALNLWWINRRTKKIGGLGLTEQGFDSLTQAGIRSYRIKMEDVIVPNNELLLWLDQTFPSPYFIKNNIRRHEIYVFDEKTAIQLVLFSGDIQKLFRAKKRFQEKVIDKKSDIRYTSETVS